MGWISKEDFWTWANTDTTGYDRHPYLSNDKFFDFDRDLWLELVKFMGRKHRSVYQDHINYVCNDIVKPFKFKILCYAERVREMHDLAKYLPPPSMKGESKMAAKWSVRNEEFTNSDLQRSIKDGVPPKIMDELDDNIEDYRSLTYEYWCDLLSTIEVKDERKRAAVYIKKIASTRPASPSDSDESVSIMRRKKAKTGV